MKHNYGKTNLKQNELVSHLFSCFLTFVKPYKTP